MKRWILKDDVIEAIHKDSVLYAKISVVLDVSITSMPRIINHNSPKLTQFSCLEVISKHLNKKQKDLIELKEVFKAVA